MKKTTNKLMIAAAFLAVATVASAQTLTADIPFAFRAGGKTMPAGAYRVELAGPIHEIVILRNFEARESALLISNGPEVATKDSKPKAAPSLTFECGAVRCSLVSLWAGFSGPGLSFAHPNLRPNERAQLMEVKLARAAE